MTAALARGIVATKTREMEHGLCGQPDDWPKSDIDWPDGFWDFSPVPATKVAAENQTKSNNQKRMKLTSSCVVSASVGLTLALGSLETAVQAQAPAPAPAVPVLEKSPWESSASLGVTLSKGNTDTLLMTANILSTRKDPKNELRLGADATYGENQGDRSAEAVHGFAQYNRLFTERFYGYVRLDGLHDEIAGIIYRVSFSPGVGYYFIKDKQTTLSGEVGPGVIHERLDGKNGTQDTDDTYMTIRLAERLEHKFSDTVRLWQSVELLPQVDRFSNFLLNAELGIETALSTKLSLRTYLVDNYDNEPAPGRKNNDLKLVAAIAYKF